MTATTATQLSPSKQKSNMKKFHKLRMFFTELVNNNRITPTPSHTFFVELAFLLGNIWHLTAHSGIST